MAKERPILLSGPMVKAILDGRKTQTRRVVKAPVHGRPFVELRDNLGYLASVGNIYAGFGAKADPVYVKCPYGQPGDLLWVRETWSSPMGQPIYRADSKPNDIGPGKKYHWTPSIHMRKQHSRLTLRTTDVRVERVQEISAEDAIAEGYGNDGCEGNSAYRWFVGLWDFIYAKRGYSWESNPWVWVISFEPIEGEK